MGKRGGKRGRGGGGRGGRHGDRQRAPRPDTRGEVVVRSNERFEKYYNSLGIIQEGEAEDFWRALRKDLPNSFRFTGSKGQALPVQQLLKDRYIPQITAIENNGVFVEPPTPIEWFPDQLAWQMTTPKNIIRRFAPFASFQKFLVSETSVGNISRQEIVSMIPPLLMDLQPGMIALDLCAAPGSKAAQLIEMVHAGEEVRMRKAARSKTAGSENGNTQGTNGQTDDPENMDWSDDGRATGLLIANDTDYKRAHMLTHQMKRLNSPNIIVTNHDATMYPSIKLPNNGGTQNKYLKFDRILADVPCSGDGTCRKNVNVWKDWTPANGVGLFSTQLRILVRALQMLKPGGRVVYSTCSMNPVENEAVVAAAIKRCGGLSKVDLIDCSERLPKLKRRNGLSEWQIMDKSGAMWKSWADVQKQKEDHGEDNLGRLSEEMFPSADEMPPMGRCMRIYPHLQDTGAFFITVLEKKAEVKSTPKAEAETSRPAAASSSIVNIVNEIEERSTDTAADPTQKIDSLDAVAPPTHSADSEGVSAAARQNKEVAPSFGVSDGKRKLNEEADAEMATKRPKFREEVDDPAPLGAEDRQVHFPPPPGAALDVSRPDTLKPAQVEIPEASSTLAAGATEPVPPEVSESTSRPNGNASNRTPRHQPFEEPFKYLPSDHEELTTISKFYDLLDRFPLDRFMVRNATGHPAKTIYYTSALAKDILTTNASTGIKFVHCGVKMFVKQDVQAANVCRWRIQSEGLPLLEHWIGDRRCVHLKNRSTLHHLLVEMFPKVEGGGWKSLGEIGERVRDIEMGCCVLRVGDATSSVPNDSTEAQTGDTKDDLVNERMVLPLWRSLHSLNLMLPKEDRKAMLLRLYNEETPLMDHSKDRFKKVKADDSEHVIEQVGEDDDAKGEEEDAEIENKNKNVDDDVELDVSTEGIVNNDSANTDGILEEDGTGEAIVDDLIT